jgi:oxaloacetate decarboxylase alpha subunit
MISNLQTQLRAAGLGDQLEKVLREVALVREDLGYPIMVSPFAQFLITQATLNVVQGERYKTVPDEIRKYALGHYGRAAAPMAPEFLERAIGSRNQVAGRPADHLAPAIPRLIEERGPFADNDHLLLAAYYDDALVRPVLTTDDEVARSLRFVTSPLLELEQYLTRSADIQHARLRFGSTQLSVGSR